MSLYVYALVSVYDSLYAYALVSVCMCMRRSVCVYVCVGQCVYVYASVSVCMCMRRSVCTRYLQPLHSHGAWVGLDLAGHQQLSRGARHLLGRRD